MSKTHKNIGKKAIWSKDIQSYASRALLFDRLKEWSSGRISREDTQMVFEI